MGKRRVPLANETFWPSVAVGDPDACWLFQRYVDRDGYGHVERDGQRYQAHHAAYLLAKGSIPNGLIVRHTCDVRACCNPAHLIVGTNADNGRDAAERLRNAHGERHFNHKLTQDAVTHILELARAGVAKKDIAQQYGVAASTITRVTTGMGWKHVEGERTVAKLNATQRLVEIVALWNDGLTQVAIARRTGLSRTRVGEALRAAGVAIGRGRLLNCRRGHPIPPGAGRKGCSVCRRDYMRAWALARRAA